MYNPPDFENKADADGNGTYEPTVVARDSEGQFGFLDIKVTVTNANESPTVTGDIAPTVDENSETFSRFYSATDPEGAASIFTWSACPAPTAGFQHRQKHGSH